MTFNPTDPLLFMKIRNLIFTISSYIKKMFQNPKCKWSNCINFEAQTQTVAVAIFKQKLNKMYQAWKELACLID